eukprot:CAMPEP_0116955022 /NCGR_PEP_ID=MMETSP0467-20121206/42346_1 /TAXON_ID=283647 /ORGANISM="Mesodinium pulex, Strain SPMC105" /LENGTH=46 /DNA_ID= /DNA_START= /DNA_END= /DNA_ORIENTATION=
MDVDNDGCITVEEWLNWIEVLKQYKKKRLTQALLDPSIVKLDYNQE